MHADAALAGRLAAEWEQRSWDGEDVSPEVDVVVLGWPAPDPRPLDALLQSARSGGTPVVLWDREPQGSAPCPFADEVELVVVGTATRAADYSEAIDTVVVGPGVQPRLHNPMRPQGGARITAAHLPGEDPDPILAGVAALVAPQCRQDRSHDVVFVGQHGDESADERVHELMAEGTVVLTSDSHLATRVPGVDLMTSVEEAEFRLKALATHSELRRRTAHLGVREALSRSTTTVATDTVLERLGLASPRRERPVTAIVPTMRPAQLDHVLEFVGRQSHDGVQLVLITHGFTADRDTASRGRELGVHNLELLEADADLTLGALMNLGVAAADGEYVAKMDDDNFYGPHYLADLLATFDFSGAQVAGKWAHWTYLQASGMTFLRFPAAENTLTRLVQGGTLVMPREVAADVQFEDLPRRVDTTFLDKVAAAGGSVYSADRYNFVSIRSADVSGHTWKISDSELLAKPSSSLFFGEPWSHAQV